MDDIPVKTKRQNVSRCFLKAAEWASPQTTRGCLESSCEHRKGVPVISLPGNSWLWSSVRRRAPTLVPWYAMCHFFSALETSQWDFILYRCDSVLLTQTQSKLNRLTWTPSLVWGCLLTWGQSGTTQRAGRSPGAALLSCNTPRPPGVCGRTHSSTGCTLHLHWSIHLNKQRRCVLDPDEVSGRKAERWSTHLVTWACP